MDVDEAFATVESEDSNVADGELEAISGLDDSVSRRAEEEVGPSDTLVEVWTALLAVWPIPDRELHMLTGMVVPSLTTPFEPTLIVWPSVVIAAPPAVNVVAPATTAPFARTVKKSESLVAVLAVFIEIVVSSRTKPPVATL